ncbi:hypothetical protein J6590_039167 [Homalodisca vitripennis]|nr:hypothetical protein J6590_039167 [Homalodisca vitripennis]
MTVIPAGTFSVICLCTDCRSRHIMRCCYDVMLGGQVGTTRTRSPPSPTTPECCGLRAPPSPRPHCCRHNWHELPPATENIERRRRKMEMECRSDRCTELRNGFIADTGSPFARPQRPSQYTKTRLTERQLARALKYSKAKWLVIKPRRNGGKIAEAVGWRVVAAAADAESDGSGGLSIRCYSSQTLSRRSISKTPSSGFNSRRYRVLKTLSTLFSARPIESKQKEVLLYFPQNRFIVSPLATLGRYSHRTYLLPALFEHLGLTFAFLLKSLVKIFFGLNNGSFQYSRPTESFLPLKQSAAITPDELVLIINRCGLSSVLAVIRVLLKLLLAITIQPKSYSHKYFMLTQSTFRLCQPGLAGEGGCSTNGTAPPTIALYYIMFSFNSLLFCGFVFVSDMKQCVLMRYAVDPSAGHGSPITKRLTVLLSVGRLTSVSSLQRRHLLRKHEHAACCGSMNGISTARCVLLVMRHLDVKKAVLCSAEGWPDKRTAPLFRGEMHG